MRVRVDVARRIEGSIEVPSAAASAPAGTAPPRAPREIAPRRTALQPAEIRTALARAYQQRTGRPITAERLDVLAAQVSHETGFGASMYNFNFGGIKGSSPEGFTARCRTKEVLQGEVKSIVDGFRAYSTADHGAADYLAFLEQRYPKAWDAAARGDVDGFVGALKQKGYFTADLAGYTAAVRGAMARGATPRVDPPTPDAPDVPLSAASAGAIAAAFATPTLPEGPTSIALARVLDAVAASSARIAGPIDDDSETT